MPTIKLPSGHDCIVDAEDYGRLKDRPWRLHKGKNGVLYAAYMGSRDDRPAMIFMHHEVLGLGPVRTDHANLNGLDNRRINLRLCTNAQNMQNRRKVMVRGVTSKFKGVRWTADGWEASLTVNKRRIYLGLFKAEDAAARAYDAAATERFGDFARTNLMLGLLKPKVLPLAKVAERLRCRSGANIGAFI